MDRATTPPTPPPTRPLTDDELLDRVERSAFQYFLDAAHSRSGLVADNTRAGAPASIAVVGFALSAYAVAVRRGWIAREEAAARTLKTLDFFRDGSQGAARDAIGTAGFYYHFLDVEDGRRVWESEVSPIDTALFIAGTLVAGAFFDGPSAVEQRVRVAAEELYVAVDWEWMHDGAATIRQGWKPEAGFLHYGWEGYSEAALLYVLALASPSHPVSASSYRGWNATYQWERIYGHDLLYAGPLFIHQFSHAWIDFRGIKDRFMRAKESDYFENSRRAVAVQREYARRNPYGFPEYGLDCWGLSACDGPGGPSRRVGGRTIRSLEYAARGAPYGPDDGTLCPPAVLASLPFAPVEVLSALRRLLARFPEWQATFRLPSGFNPGAPGADDRGWVSDGSFGLDQGIVLLMIENHRSGFVWDLMRRSPVLRAGLRRAGFRGGWL